ncbi:MAG: hypothetical protein CL535_11255 [Ahrensia sp.]|nr:hypothetical protein [Ahrensia sp.]
MARRKGWNGAGVLLSLAIGSAFLLASDSAHAQQFCTQAFLEEKDKDLPDIIVADTEDDFVQSIEIAYGCQFAPYVSGQDDTILFREPGDELTVRAVRPGNVFGGENSVATILALELGTFDAREMTVANMDTPAEIGPLKTWLNWFLPPKRLLIELISEPSGGRVNVGSVSFGETQLLAAIRRSALRQIEIRMDGFLPCRFEDGKFEENAVPRSKFTCKLTSESEGPGAENSAQ